MADARREGAEFLACPFDCRRICTSCLSAGPGALGEVGEPHLARRRERVIAGKHEAQLVLKEVFAVEGRVGDRSRVVVVSEDQIEVAEPQRGQGLLGVGLDDLDLERRVIVPKPVEGRCQQCERGRLERGDSEPTMRGPRLRCEFGLGVVKCGEDAVRMGREHAAGVGQPNAATDPLEQCGARLPLQLGQLLRDGRGREGQRFGDGSDRPSRLELAEKAQPPQFDHVAELTSCVKKKSLLFTISAVTLPSVTVAPSPSELQRLVNRPRTRLACLPTPLHPLRRLTAELGGPEIWIKRDDLSGLTGGGNKTRKLEFVVADALEAGATVLVTVGAVQSNHTRQTAAAAAKVGLDCVLLHNNWAPAPGPYYRRVGNVLLSDLLGARLFYDATKRLIGDDGQLEALVEHLRAEGGRPYLIPGGASEHHLGGLGYVVCATEIVAQAHALGLDFDCVVHCTGSGSTQAGLLAGFTALRSQTRVIGVSDDDETAAKARRVLRLANAALDELDLPTTISRTDVKVITADPNAYGVAAPETTAAMRLLARTEGIIADPVYEGKALRGLIELIRGGVLGGGNRVLLLHLGGTPAVHAYADQVWQDSLRDLRTLGLRSERKQSPTRS
jgi:1-aminocyclopropane-1-carboxylate deaminase